MLVSDRIGLCVSFMDAWSSSWEKGGLLGGRKGAPGLSGLSSCLSGGLGPGAWEIRGTFLDSAPSVPLSGHMGESWAGIWSRGPECRSATGLGLGLCLSGPGLRGPRRRGMGKVRTLGSWESRGRRGAAREAGSDCIGKKFPLFPASGKSLGT